MSDEIDKLEELWSEDVPIRCPYDCNFLKHVKYGKEDYNGKNMYCEKYKKYSNGFKVTNYCDINSISFVMD